MAGPYPLVPTSYVKLQDAQTTGAGGVFLPRGAIARLTVVIQSSGTTSTGAISIEEAFYEDQPSNGGIGASAGVQYAGAWSVIQSIDMAPLTGGDQQIVHVQGSVWALRCRITTAVGGGGSVTAWAYGN